MQLFDISKRLPAKNLLTCTEVAIAADLSVQWVTRKIDEGAFEAINMGSPTKPYWKIPREGLINWFNNRSTFAGKK